MKTSARLFKTGGSAALILAVGLVCLPAETDAAGFATGGSGLRARAMGGAFRGVANDWSAAVYNPAGLAFLEGNRFDLALGTYSPRLTYTPNVSGNGVDIGFDAANGLEIPTRNDLWPIPSLSGILIPESMEGTAIGLAITWPHDANYSWDLYRQPATYNSDPNNFPVEDYRTDMDVLDIRPVMARQLSENFAVGVGLSLTNADIVLRRVQFVENTLGAPYDVDPFNNLVGDLRLEGNGFAVGANIGLFWKASEKLSVGVNLQSPISVSMSGGATLSMAWPLVDNLRDRQLNQDADGDNKPDFDRSIFGGNDVPGVSAESVSRAPWEFDLDLPGQIGFGIGWQGSERFILAFDAVWTLWSSVDDWDIRFLSFRDSAGATVDGLLGNVDSLNSITATTIPFGWDTSMRLSGGWEYKASESVAILGGAYWENGAAVDETFSPNFPDVGDRFGISGGFTYSVAEMWEFGLAQEIAFFSDRTVPDAGAANGITVFPGDYAMTRYETLISLGYRF